MVVSNHRNSDIIGSVDFRASFLSVLDGRLVANFAARNHSGAVVIAKKATEKLKSQLPIDVQGKPESPFLCRCLSAMSLRKPLLKDVHRYADRFLLATRKYEPPEIIGA